MATEELALQTCERNGVMADNMSAVIVFIVQTSQEIYKFMNAYSFILYLMYKYVKLLNQHNLLNTFTLFQEIGRMGWSAVALGLNCHDP